MSGTSKTDRSRALTAAESISIAPARTARNRRLSHQERIASRLDRLRWITRPDAEGYFFKGACRVIVWTEGTLLTAFDAESVQGGLVVSSSVAYECSFGPTTPFQVVIAAAEAAVEV
jgi:hypothetical protein